MFYINVKRAIVLVLFIWQVCLTERRIQNGQKLTEDKKYMAYFIRASDSEQQYDAWLCGGTIVTSSFIITSAACIEDVKFMYAIAGYRKYVKLENLNQDECTKVAKKKVIYTCVPKNYDFEYDKIEIWSNIDIGIARVDSPFDFTQTYVKCSYAPDKLRVNFEEKYQMPGVDTFVLGWGHENKWREPADSNDYNQKDLHYTTTIIIKKEECKNAYSNVPKLSNIIDKYMICADGPGNISPQGEIIEESKRDTQGCSRRHRNSELCEDKHVRPINNKKSSARERPRPNRGGHDQPNPSGHGQPYRKPAPQTKGHGRHNPGNRQAYGMSMRPTYRPSNYKGRPRSLHKSRRSMDAKLLKDLKERNADFNSTNGAFTQNTTFFGTSTGRFTNASRRNGICQNDHGGPLVSWVGSREYLIGVASVFRIDEKRDCTGPYLYTSTQCNAAFLNCVLKEDKDWEQIRPSKSYLNGYTTRDFCSLPPQKKKFDIVRRHISWAHHPDGPADNELTQHDLENVEMRPQIPMNAFAGR